MNYKIRTRTSKHTNTICYALKIFIILAKPEPHKFLKLKYFSCLGCAYRDYPAEGASKYSARKNTNIRRNVKKLKGERIRKERKYETLGGMKNIIY